MTASGPEDTGASWVGRQLLKSAHWTRESPLSAIRVLRETDSLSLEGRSVLKWMSCSSNTITVEKLNNVTINASVF